MSRYSPPPSYTPPAPYVPPAPTTYYKAGLAGFYGAGGGSAMTYNSAGSQGIIIIEYEPLGGGGETAAAFMTFAM